MLRRWFGEERDALGDGTLDVWDAAAAVFVGDAISTSAQRGAAVACNVPLRPSAALAG
jgi:hypothetical protein